MAIFTFDIETLGWDSPIAIGLYDGKGKYIDFFAKDNILLIGGATFATNTGKNSLTFDLRLIWFLYILNSWSVNNKKFSNPLTYNILSEYYSGASAYSPIQLCFIKHSKKKAIERYYFMSKKIFSLFFFLLIISQSCFATIAKKTVLTSPDGKQRIFLNWDLHLDKPEINENQTKKFIEEYEEAHKKACEQNKQPPLALFEMFFDEEIFEFHKNTYGVLVEEVQKNKAKLEKETFLLKHRVLSFAEGHPFGDITKHALVQIQQECKEKKLPVMVVDKKRLSAFAPWEMLALCPMIPIFDQYDMTLPKSLRTTKLQDLFLPLKNLFMEALNVSNKIYEQTNESLFQDLAKFINEKIEELEAIAAQEEYKPHLNESLYDALEKKIKEKYNVDNRGPELSTIYNLLQMLPGELEEFLRKVFSGLMAPGGNEQDSPFLFLMNTMELSALLQILENKNKDHIFSAGAMHCLFLQRLLDRLGYKIIYDSYGTTFQPQPFPPTDDDMYTTLGPIIEKADSLSEKIPFDLINLSNEDIEKRWQ